MNYGEIKVNVVHRVEQGQMKWRFLLEY